VCWSSKALTSASFNVATTSGGVFFGANRACHADTLNCGIPPVVPQVQAGTIKALAIASAKRSPALKDVPTATEALMI